MPESRRDARRVPATVERFLKQLVITYKAVGLYPPQSSIPRENATHVVSLLRSLLESQPEARLEVGKDGLLYQGILLFPGQSAYKGLAREMYHRRLADVRFHAGADVSDILGFLALLYVPPEDITAAGGFESGLWERSVDDVTVTEVEIRIYDNAEEPSDADAGQWPPEAQRIEHLLVGTFARRGRDHLVLEKVLFDPKAISVFLAEGVAVGKRPAAEVASRLESLAHAVEESAPEKRSAMFRAIAEAVLGLDADVRREVVRTRMLPDSRNDEPIAQVLRQMSLDQVANILVEGFAAGEATQEGLSRAIRNLAQICLVGRDEVVNSVGAAMRAQGIGETEIGEVLGGIQPRRLEVRERPRPAGERPVESILRLVDIAPAEELADVAQDPELEELRREAHRGFTDGDVLIALVALVALDPRPHAFASVMSIVEDGAGVLLERGEFEVAAEVAEMLTEAKRNDALDGAQQGRIARALETMATPEQMRTLNHAFRVYPEGSAEHEACSRLLRTLGGHVLQPMLEVLAREQDMSARKSMVDLMSTMADEFVNELGQHVTDSRWYFVRNVVSILGKTRGPEILPYLERTLRHPDARVRRETIRAAAAVHLATADQMLVSALEDEDAQNVSLAARYVGLNRVRGGVRPLIAVARGEGAGNRDMGSRVEAIEALGRVGDPSALPALEALAGRRTMLRGRGKEIRSAAAAAIDVLQTQTSGGGA